MIRWYRGRGDRHCSAKAITVVRPVSFEWGSSSVVELQTVALVRLVQFQPVPLRWCSSKDRATACEAVDGSSSLPIAFHKRGEKQFTKPLLTLLHKNNLQLHQIKHIT